jgi:Flp pilus assembly protein TadG
MRKRKLFGERGGALVETALVIPLLAWMMLGSAELGRIAYAAIEASNAARAGAAFGAQGVVTTTETPITSANIEQAAVNDAADFVSGGLQATANIYCVCLTTNASTGGVSSTPQVLCTSSTATSATYCPTSTTTKVQNTIIHYVEVSTTATVKSMFHYPGLPTSYKLNGFSEMRVDQ